MLLNLSAELQIPAQSYSLQVYTVSCSNPVTGKILMHYKGFRNESAKQLQGLRKMTIHIRVLVKNLKQFSVFL